VYRVVNLPETLAITPSRQNGLGFSLTPPSWLTNIGQTAQRVATAISYGGTRAQSVVDAYGRAVAPPPRTAIEQAEYVASQVPGWVLPAGIAVAALLLLRGRRR
jgi:hypothetical protein